MLLCVIDQGTGIPGGELGHVFRPFHKARSGQNKEGTGLGLYLCHTLAERMGGRFGLTTRTPGGNWAATGEDGPPPPDQAQGTMAWLWIEVEAPADDAWMELSAIHDTLSRPLAREAPPPPETLAALGRLCAAGDVDGLLAQAEALRAGQPAFARRLRELAETIQLDELAAWLAAMERTDG